MTKTEAKQALLTGNKITHTLFTSDEFITYKNGFYYDEGGRRINMEEFWFYRMGKAFDTGWEIKN